MFNCKPHFLAFIYIYIKAKKCGLQLNIQNNVTLNNGLINSNLNK